MCLPTPSAQSVRASKLNGAGGTALPLLASSNARAFPKSPLNSSKSPQKTPEIGMDLQDRRTEFIPRLASDNPLNEQSSPPPVHSKGRIFAIADRGVGMLFDVGRGLLPANQARVYFNALIEQTGISARARAQLSAAFTAGLLNAGKARQLGLATTSRPRPADLRRSDWQPEPAVLPFDPDQPDGQQQSVGPILGPPQPDAAKSPTLKNEPSSGPAPERLRTTANGLPPTFSDSTGLAVRPLDQGEALIGLGNDLEAHAQTLSRFAGSLEGVVRGPATELARSTIERHLAMFWRLHGFAIDTGDRQLREALVRDIGEFLGGQTALYLDAGLPDAARIYALLSPQARRTLVDGFLGALAEAANMRFSGILDTSTNPFTRRTLPQALAVLRRRHPGLRQPRRNSSAGSLDEPVSATTKAPGSDSSSDGSTLAQKRAITLRKNKAMSDIQEAEIAERLQQSRFIKKFARQVSIVVEITGAMGEKTVVRTRVDFVAIDHKNRILVFDGKSSKTARLTRNQKRAFPQIEASGGRIVGKKSQELDDIISIPPGRVRIIRPTNE